MSNKLKNILAMLISMCLVIPGANAVGENEDEITVSIMAADQQQYELISRLAKQYLIDEEIEDVRFDISYIEDKSLQEYSIGLDAALSDGTAPTLFPVFSSWDIAGLYDRLAPMDGTIASMYSVWSLLAPATIDETIYGVPMDLHGFGIIYNATVFEEAEIDPFLVMTYDDFEEAVLWLDEIKGELGIDAVFGLDDESLVDLGAILGEFAIAAEYEESYQAAKARAFNFTYSGMFDMYSRVIAAYSDFYEADMDMVAAFEDGKIAMIVGSTDTVLNPDMNVGVIPLEFGISNAVLVKSSAYWAMNGSAADDEKIEAEYFLDWLLCGDELSREYYRTQGIIPPYTGFYDVGLSPLAQAFYDFADFDETLIAMDDACPEGYIQTVFGDNFREYIHGRMQLEDFITAASEGW